MNTMDRRCFIKTAALACPLIAAGAIGPAWARRKGRADVYVVLKEKCDGCGDCVKACPVEAIKIKDENAVIDMEECIECDACVDGCPTGAIVKKEAPAQADRAAAPAGIVGLWVFTGIFSDGTTSEPETVRFAGTSTSGNLLSAATGEIQGSYKVDGVSIELRLLGDILAAGRIVSADLMEGTMPRGKWKAERKK